jgi:hypothetical protein
VTALLQQYPQLASVYQQLLATLVPGRDWTDVVTTVVQVLPTVISVISRKSSIRFLSFNWIRFLKKSSLYNFSSWLKISVLIEKQTYFYASKFYIFTIINKFPTHGNLCNYEICFDQFILCEKSISKWIK